MTRNLKAMGLALLCVFALGALGAQSASAVVEHSFTANSGSEKTVLTATTEAGTQEILSVTNASIKCEDISYRATIVGKAVDHIAVVPIFGGATCTSGIGAATLHNNGCTYTFDSETFENTTHYGAGPLHSNMSMSCGHTGTIVVTTGGCTISVGDTHAGGVSVNQNLPGIRFTELPNHSGSKTGMTAEATLKTVKVTSIGANCALLGLGPNGTHTNGTYSGKGTITGYEDLGGSNPHTEAMSEGSLISIGLSTP